MQSLLHGCQTRLEAARKSGLSFLDAYGPDELLDEVTQRHLAPVWHHGRVVWGCIVKANGRLHQEGDDSQLGYLVFHPGTEFAAQPEHLKFLAFWVRNSALDDPEPPVARFAELVADDFAHVSNERVPARLAFGHEVYYTRVLLLRAGFPRRRIETRLVPLVIWPEGAPDCCVLPGRLWADEVAVRLAELEEQAGGMMNSPPSRTPPALPTAYPQAPAFVWESLRGTHGEPPRLAKHALAGIRRTFREQGFDPTEWFVWRTVADGETDARSRRTVRFRRFGAAPPAGGHCRQEEFTLVWHPDHAALVDGCVIQLEDNWMIGPWYRFADPLPPARSKFWIYLPGIASAEERGSRYEEPLLDFLSERDLGEIVDRGMWWAHEPGPTPTNAEAHIGIETAKPERLLAELIPFLGQLDVPSGTYLESNGERRFILPRPPPNQG